MSYRRSGDTTRIMPKIPPQSPQQAPQQPPQQPRPPRRPRRSDGWSPGVFSPAIFLVALLVIGLLVGAAVLNQRARTTPIAVTTVGNQTAVAGAPTAPANAARTFIVANTGGEGVYLRRTPRLDDRDTAYTEGTQLVAIGADVDGDGQSWHHVRAPDGKTGYVPTRYTKEVPR